MIDRKNSGAARNTLDIAANRIAKKKTSVWLFPEGTRSNGRGILPFKQGAFRLAKTTNEPVVMVTASNLHKKVRWNKWNNGIVLIDISAPQPLTEEHSIKEWMGIFNEQMKEKFEQLNEQVDDLEKSR